MFSPWLTGNVAGGVVTSGFAQTWTTAGFHGADSQVCVIGMMMGCSTTSVQDGLSMQC